MTEPNKFKAVPLAEFLAEYEAERQRLHDLRIQREAADPDLKIVRQFGTWAVTEYGLECLQTSYEIEKERLVEDNGMGTLGWLIHMSEKNWVNFAHLLPAFQAAMVYHHPGRTFTWVTGLYTS